MWIFSSGVSSEVVSLCEVLRFIRGDWETCVCGMLSRGLGASVLAFFGERGPVVVGHGGGSEWSDTGRLGAWRSARTGPGGLWTGPSVYFT